MRRLCSALLAACTFVSPAVIYAANATSASAAPKPAGTDPTTKPDPLPTWANPGAKPPLKPADRPVPAVSHVVLISIDGLRPDLLLRAKTPNLHALFENGSYSFWAKTTPNSITLPSHTSMLTGVGPRKHGIEWNRDLPLSKPIYPMVPTIFAVAKRYGYTTALMAGKSKFEFLEVPGTIDFVSVPDKRTSKDPDVAEHAAGVLRQNKPDFFFLHLPDVDSAGHSKGWGSPEQVIAVEEADKAVGIFVGALGSAGLRDSTMVIVTADHGGTGRNHGPDDARSRHIPWIINGPGIRKGIDLTFYDDLEIRTEDSFATTCYLLGIPLSKGIDGKPVLQAFVGFKPQLTPTATGELLKDVAGAPTTPPAALLP